MLVLLVVGLLELLVPEELVESLVVLVESTEEVVEVGRGVEDDEEGLLEGISLVEVTGELLGDGLEDEGEGVGVGV